MRIRLDATTRSPASSSMLVTAPVRLRRVASGLMIEKVRVAAMTGRSPVNGWSGIGAPPSGGSASRQVSAFPDPFAAFSRPITALDAFPAGEQLPGEPSILERVVAEQKETAVVGQRGLAPCTVGNEHVA